MNKLISTPLHHFQIASHDAINQQLMDGLFQFIDHEKTRKTHHFHGRYENIYIDTQYIPSLQTILTQAISCAADILQVPEDSLKAGLWFNLMYPGDKTTLHRHDDNDEMLSAVYYVRTTENCGTLLLGKPPLIAQVTPVDGMFVFFPPNMPHEVTENLSDEHRVSLGINIGPVNTDNKYD